MEYAIREAPNTPELLEIITSNAPMIGTYSCRMNPMYGNWPANNATALSLLAVSPRYWNAGTPWMFDNPSTRLEYDSAKIKIVSMSATDVRGITVEGRWVSSAACEMLSSPTKEIMAKETPSSNSLVCGQWACIVCSRSCGCQANKNPHTSITTSLQTSMTATTSLRRDDCRTPMMLSSVKKAVTPSTPINRMSA